MRSSNWTTRLLGALLGLAVAVGPVRAEELRGRVVGLADGDTATVIGSDNAQHRVRIAGIDAPERGQPGAQRSKESLAALVHDQPVRVEWRKRDRFDGIVGKIWVASPDSPCRGKPDCPMTVDVGLVQITIGRAWWSRKHADEQSPEDRGRYESAEQEARARKTGLWRDGTAVPPWEWRERRGERRANRSLLVQVAGGKVVDGRTSDPSAPSLDGRLAALADAPCRPAANRCHRSMTIAFTAEAPTRAPWPLRTTS